MLGDFCMKKMKSLRAIHNQGSPVQGELSPKATEGLSNKAANELCSV